MIKITVFVDEYQHIQQLVVTGHAEYAEHGSDIVCAAVSSQVISVENSLVQLLNIDVITEVDEIEGGYLKMIIPPNASKAVMQEAQLLLKHLKLALSTIAKSYPKFVTIRTKKLKQ